MPTVDCTAATAVLATVVSAMAVLATAVSATAEVTTEATAAATTADTPELAASTARVDTDTELAVPRRRSSVRALATVIHRHTVFRLAPVEPTELDSRRTVPGLRRPVTVPEVPEDTVVATTEAALSVELQVRRYNALKKTRGERICTRVLTCGVYICTRNF